VEVADDDVYIFAGPPARGLRQPLAWGGGGRIGGYALEIAATAFFSFSVWLTVRVCVRRDEGAQRARRQDAEG
jgi:hypothetical protein